ERLQRVAPFASVTDEQARRFLAAGRERVVDPGEAVTVRWSYARTFSLVLSGRLELRVGERQLSLLCKDDHFGEIAAIDWGRDFSDGRTATVAAVEPTRILEIPASALRDLMAEARRRPRAAPHRPGAARPAVSRYVTGSSTPRRRC